MKKKDDPPLWLIVTKLVLGATLLIGGVGLALWYVDQAQSDAIGPAKNEGWGIVTDSPIRSNR